MQFPVRSLGGKLIIVATLILLVCLLLFMLVTWSLLRFYSEHEAQTDAQTHLALIQRTYHTYSTNLSKQLLEASKNSLMTTAISQPSLVSAERLQSSLLPLFLQNHLSDLEVVTNSHQLLTHIQFQGQQGQNMTAAELTLVDQTMQSGQISFFQQVSDRSGKTEQTQWQLRVSLPIYTNTGARGGVLLVAQPIDSMLTQLLMQQSGSNVAICISGQVISATELTVESMQAICLPGTPHLISGSQHYLTLSNTLSGMQQTSNSLHLIAVTIEPLYGLNLQRPQQLFIVFGIGLFIFALGVILYVFVIRTVFTQPMRQLQSDVRILIANNNGADLLPSEGDELHMLSRSFNLLSESLESESQAMTEQMSNLLLMSDALISTLNLDQLLGEIVSRLGTIMHVKHVALLLYGREMLSPWAAAHFSVSQNGEESESRFPGHPASPGQSALTPGQVTVHIDSAGDITMTATTKMAAVPNGKSRTASDKHNSVRAVSASSQHVRRPHIPRSALRELDLILARLVIQKQKIACGEDISSIFAERQENWTRLALEEGYRSVIAVPLLLQEQAIGAFILYADEPHMISSRDTFLLSTAAIQVSMAIQNALLFAEVKEKNTALEQANHLKSQFLANVTHELRTPLHSIISYGALILEGFLDGDLTIEQDQHIQFMVRRAEDLSHLVDDMLDLSKIEADKIEVKVEPLDLSTSLEEVVEQLKPMANSKDLYLRLEIAPGLSRVVADGHRLRQVAINLVSNALKFTEKGGVTIHCRVVQEGEMVLICVQDTGIGISPAALGYIFEAFRQADGSTTRRFGGTGLGLTIVKKLIELQGGEVMVESIPNQGSTFSFSLPVSPLEEIGQ